MHSPSHVGDALLYKKPCDWCRETAAAARQLYIPKCTEPFIVPHGYTTMHCLVASSYLYVLCQFRLRKAD